MKPATIDIILAEEKKKNFDYTQRKIFETELNIMYQMSQNSDKSMSSLVKKFMTNIQAYSDANSLLAKYSLNIEDLFEDNTIVENTVEDTINSYEEQPLNNIEDQPLNNIEENIDKPCVKKTKTIKINKKPNEKPKKTLLIKVKKT